MAGGPLPPTHTKNPCAYRVLISMACKVYGLTVSPIHACPAPAPLYPGSRPAPTCRQEAKEERPHLRARDGNAFCVGAVLHPIFQELHLVHSFPQCEPARWVHIHANITPIGFRARMTGKACSNGV